MVYTKQYVEKTGRCEHYFVPCKTFYIDGGREDAFCPDCGVSLLSANSHCIFVHPTDATYQREFEQALLDHGGDTHCVLAQLHGMTYSDGSPVICNHGGVE
jgi:hypothetical protein